MHDADHGHPHEPGFLAKLVVRLYALVLVGAVLVCTYMAFAYLLEILFFPQLTPADYVNRPMRLDPASLHAGSKPAIRPQIDTAPIDHYHGLGHARFTRPLSGCTVSGCHSPLPHTGHKDSRAFANLHTTFLDCSMCHHEDAAERMETVWIDPLSGAPRDTPAILQLTRVMEDGDRAGEDPDLIRRLVRESVVESGGDESLRFLSVQLDTSVSDSPVFARALDSVRAELPKFDRGEYGALIAPKPADQLAVTGNRRLMELARRRLSTPPDSPEHKELYDEIHAKVIAKPTTCLGCHSADAPRLDLDALGYSAKRAEQLLSLAIARITQGVRDGTDFRLPNVLEERRSE